jgi:catechol 2,3-dioxygenase-like lactoylglutathione lyase family enzyme
MARATGIAHVIYYVSSMDASVAFYTNVLGLEVVDSLGDAGLFLRVADSERHFDLGLIEVGDEASVTHGNEARHGVYHVGWNVESLDDFADLYSELDAGDLLIGSADHGTHLSLYAVDPDDNEVELCWSRPVHERPAHGLEVVPLDIEAEVRRRDEATQLEAGGKGD